MSTATGAVLDAGSARDNRTEYTGDNLPVEKPSAKNDNVAPPTPTPPPPPRGGPLVGHPGIALARLLHPNGPNGICTKPVEASGDNPFTRCNAALDDENGMNNFFGDARRAKLQVYIHAATGLEHKARYGKKDIKEARALWVDCDPKDVPGYAKEHFDDVRAHIRAALEGYRLPPNIIIDSGNGYQAYWILTEPFRIDGDEERWREFERRNIGLCEEFKNAGADSCWSVEHLMRLPGTTNFLTAGKKEFYPAGDRPAQVVRWEVQ